jgi:hypothetical protein
MNVIFINFFNFNLGRPFEKVLEML